MLADGSIRFKLPWWRDVSGELSITGRNMNNTDADLEIDVPGGYGDTGFQASELVFGSPGCWEVTGSVGDS